MKPSPRMVFSDVLVAIVGVAVLMTVVSAVMAFDLFEDEVELFEASIVLSILMILFSWAYSTLRHRNLEYRMADDALVISDGLIKRKEKIIPYSKIASVKVVRTGKFAFDQVFGLTAVRITTDSGEIVLRGIEEPEVFLRRLMAGIEGNEYVKESEVYMTEREILLKLSRDLRNLHNRLDNIEKTVVFKGKAKGGLADLKDLPRLKDDR